MDNYVQEGEILQFTNTGTAISSGDPVMMGNIPGVAVTDIAATTGVGSVQIKGVFNLSVVGADDSGNVAVALFDDIFYDSGVLNKDAQNGKIFGHALGTVGSGETTTIPVLVANLQEAPTAVRVAIEDAGGYTTEEDVEGALQEIYLWMTGVPLALTADATSISDTGDFTDEDYVEGALQEVYQHLLSDVVPIPIPLTAFTLEDGTPLAKFADGDSATPGFAQISNKELVIRWNNHASPTAIITNIAIPELDGAGDLLIQVQAAASGATDTPELTTEAYFGAGDTDCAGTDDEVDGGITVTKYTNTIAAADVPDGPTNLTFLFGPKAGELGTDDLLIYAVWVERKVALRTS